MKAAFLQTMVYAIELPLAICLLMGFLLLLLLHFIRETPENDPEESDVRLHPRTKDRFWIY